jgi:hypothetical protein
MKAQPFIFLPLMRERETHTAMDGIKMIIIIMECAVIN